MSPDGLSTSTIGNTHSVGSVTSSITPLSFMHFSSFSTLPNSSIGICLAVVTLYGLASLFSLTFTGSHLTSANTEPTLFTKFIALAVSLLSKLSVSLSATKFFSGMFFVVAVSNCPSTFITPPGLWKTRFVGWSVVLCVKLSYVRLLTTFTSAPVFILNDTFRPHKPSVTRHGFSLPPPMESTK